MEKAKKYVEVNEVGNGFVLRLFVGDADGDRLVKESVVVNSVGETEMALGAGIVELLSTRIRSRSKKVAQQVLPGIEKEKS